MFQSVISQIKTSFLLFIKFSKKKKLLLFLLRNIKKIDRKYHIWLQIKFIKKYLIITKLIIQ